MTDVKLSILLFPASLPEEDIELCKTAIRSASAGLETELCLLQDNGISPDSAVLSCKGDYVLCMNSRILVGEDTLRTLCFFMDEHPDAGLVGVKMQDGCGNILPESEQLFPSSWKRLLFKVGIGKSDNISPFFSFFIFKRETWEKIYKTDSIYSDLSAEIALADRMRNGGFTNYSVPERVVLLKSGRPLIKQKTRRVLIIGYENELEAIKSSVIKKVPHPEYINLWNLGESRVLDAICRKNKMKSFTDILFTYPSVRMEQILLFMDRMPENTVNYHIYNKEKDQLITTVE